MKNTHKKQEYTRLYYGLTPIVIPAKPVLSRVERAGIQIFSPAFYAGFVPSNRQYYTLQAPDYQENLHPWQGVHRTPLLAARESIDKHIFLLHPHPGFRNLSGVLRLAEL